MIETVEPAVARRMWGLLEPYHAVVYFADEVRDAMTALGLQGFWMGYFAGRAAPVGPVGPEVVTAMFFGFHPRMPARALPDAWARTSPAEVLRARDAAVGAVLERVLGDEVAGDTVVEAAHVARVATEACEVAGRPLFAAHAARPWPEAPHLALWHATTLLREHRGDGHVIALAAEGLDGCSAHVLAVASGAVTRERLQPARGWSDDDWEAASARLEGLDLTDLRARVEVRTDRLALAPWKHLGAERTERLAGLLEPLAERVMASGTVPVPNPIGMRWPPDGSQPSG